jgi:hypothetical protein
MRPAIMASFAREAVGRQRIHPDAAAARFHKYRVHC